MDGMFAYGGTDRVGDVEALPLEVRWPAFAELLARGRARGRVTRDEFEAALPPGQVSQEDIDEGSAVLEELSIDVVEAERDQTAEDEVPNAAASVARVEEEDEGPAPPRSTPPFSAARTTRSASSSVRWATPRS